MVLVVSVFCWYGAPWSAVTETERKGNTVNRCEVVRSLSVGIVLLVSVMMACAAPAVAPDEEHKPEKISLWTGQAPVGDGKFVAANATVTIYRPVKANGAAIVICPGGGYQWLAVQPEGHGIARWLNQHGIVGIVLEYRMPNGNPLVPLLDAQRTIRMVRSKAKDWGCDPKRIGILGFSAGGHLASTASTHFDNGEPRASDLVDRVSSRPDFTILIYPVIAMGEKAHGGSRRNLLGREPTAAALELYSNEKQVTDKTPSAFLAHAKDDSGVSPDNSRMYYEALLAHKVPAKYLELPYGNHGLNGYKGPMWDAWQTQSLEWLAALKIIPVNASPRSDK